MSRAAQKSPGSRTGIKAAQTAREAKILDTIVDFGGLGLMTRRNFIDMARRQGAQIKIFHERRYDKEDKLEEKLRRMAQYVAFGNPNLPETREYYALRDQLKAGIYDEQTRLEFPSGTSYEITKTEFDYFNR